MARRRSNGSAEVRTEEGEEEVDDSNEPKDAPKDENRTLVRAPRRLVVRTRGATSSAVWVAHKPYRKGTTTGGNGEEKHGPSALR